MLFSSITFLIFFLPFVLVVYYYLTNIKYRNLFLLFVSLIFYAWGEPKFIILMALSILINYRMALFIGNATYSGKNRKIFLFTAVFINLFLLFLFKYLDFSIRITNTFLQWFNFTNFRFGLVKLALPIGISFYTFQSISYLVDVYKTPSLLQKNIADLGLYISFFPQLIAGPIVRYHDINIEIKERYHSLDLFVKGIERFVIGLSKKLLIANTMAEVVDRIIALPHETVPPIYLILCICAYALQIYYDFSGYSDMAIGLGKMFGFNFLENFNYPYSSKSITEFWRKWHISLSSWFKDYLYIPLGGNRRGKMRTVVNLFIVFFVTGLWHGAEAHFVFWGLGHGALLFWEKLFGKKISSAIHNRRIKSVLGHVYTISSVLVLWVFFRLGLKESFMFLYSILGKGVALSSSLDLLLIVDFRFYLFFVVGIVFSFPWWRKIKVRESLFFVMIKYISLIMLIFFDFGALATNVYNPFIYFRF